MKRTDQGSLAFSYRHPTSGVIAGLPFEISILSFIPVQNRVGQIVEDDIANVCPNR
jgi:hypothetical protein